MNGCDCVGDASSRSLSAEQTCGVQEDHDRVIIACKAIHATHSMVIKDFIGRLDIALRNANDSGDRIDEASRQLSIDLDDDRLFGLRSRGVGDKEPLQIDDGDNLASQITDSSNMRWNFRRRRNCL